MFQKIPENFFLSLDVQFLHNAKPDIQLYFLIIENDEKQFTALKC